MDLEFKAISYDGDVLGWHGGGGLADVTTWDFCCAHGLQLDGSIGLGFNKRKDVTQLIRELPVDSGPMRLDTEGRERKLEK
jgi:hypothetical protein